MQPLHLVVEPEAEAQAVLIAFASEEKRDATYGIQLCADEEAIPPPKDTFPLIYDLPGFRGRAWVVRGSIANLERFLNHGKAVTQRRNAARELPLQSHTVAMPWPPLHSVPPAACAFACRQDAAAGFAGAAFE